MPQKHELEIVIGADGQVRLDVKGLKGPTCLTAIKTLADGLGTITKTDLKPEYYEKAKTDEQSKQSR